MLEHNKDVEPFGIRFSILYVRVEFHGPFNTEEKVG